MGLHHHSTSSYDKPATTLVSNPDGTASHARTVMDLGRPRRHVRATIAIPGNPDPAKFEVLRSLQVGSALVVEIRYSGCTNYEGRKILVYFCTDLVALLKQAEKTGIDPHFSARDDLITPFARLEPTPAGWLAAERLVEEA